RLDAFRPAPAGLQFEAPHRVAGQPHDLDLRLVRRPQLVRRIVRLRLEGADAFCVRHDTLLHRCLVDLSVTSAAIFLLKGATAQIERMVILEKGLSLRSALNPPALALPRQSRMS